MTLLRPSEIFSTARRSGKSAAMQTMFEHAYGRRSNNSWWEWQFAFKRFLQEERRKKFASIIYKPGREER